MSCGNYDITAQRHETLVVDLVYKDSLGVPVDISTNFLVTWTVDQTAYVSGVDPEVVIGPGVGGIHLKLATADVDALPRVSEYYLVLTDLLAPAGFGDEVLIEGFLEVE